MTDHYPTPVWAEPSYQCAHWDSYLFSAFDHSANGDVVELGAVHRGPAYDKVLVKIGGVSVFLTPEDAEHFAGAVLTVVEAAKQHQKENQ